MFKCQSVLLSQVIGFLGTATYWDILFPIKFAPDQCEADESSKHLTMAHSRKMTGMKYSVSPKRSGIGKACKHILIARKKAKKKLTLHSYGMVERTSSRRTALILVFHFHWVRVIGKVEDTSGVTANCRY